MVQGNEKNESVLDFEQFKWLMSRHSEVKQELFRKMLCEDLKLVWHDDRHAFVLEPKVKERTIKERIRKISKDIESYERAIENAEGALVEAERELDEVLADCYAEEQAGQETGPDA